MALTVKKFITSDKTDAVLGLTQGKGYTPEAITVVEKVPEYDRIEYTFKSDTGKMMKAVEDINGMIIYETS